MMLGTVFVAGTTNRPPDPSTQEEKIQAERAKIQEERDKFKAMRAELNKIRNAAPRPLNPLMSALIPALISAQHSMSLHRKHVKKM